MSSIKNNTTNKNLGGRPAGSGIKDKKDKVKQENLKVWLSTLFKARALQEMTGKKMTVFVDRLITEEYLKVCEQEGITPQEFPNTLAELEKYKSNQLKPLEKSNSDF